MRISHRYKFIFFANPKTGSSSVRTFLAPYSDVLSVKNHHYISEDNPFYPHMTPAEARPFFEQFGWPFNDYYKFVFVRNPWARLVSAYEHIKRSTDKIPVFRKWLFQIKPFEDGGGGSDTLYIDSLLADVVIQETASNQYTVLADDFSLEFINIETLYFTDSQYIL